MTKLLPTSTAGSLPKPSWLAQPETLWSPWKLQDTELSEGKQDALLLALQEQQHAGIDIVSDGEQTRQHFVTTFIEHLSGVDFDKRETVRIRDRYDASVPTVVGAVSRPRSVFVDDAKFLRQQTRQPIKWALPGPMTMIDTLYDAHYKSRENWHGICQDPESGSQGTGSRRRGHHPVRRARLQCLLRRGQRLGSPPWSAQWKDSPARPPSTSAMATASRPIPTGSRPWDRSGASTKSRFPLQTSSLDIISLECHNSHVPIDLIELVRGKKVMVGAIDVASTTIETPQEVAETLRKALRFVDADKLYPATNCGMAPLARHVARGKLHALSAGAQIVRGELSA